MRHPCADIIRWWQARFKSIPANNPSSVNPNSRERIVPVFQRERERRRRKGPFLFIDWPCIDLVDTKRWKFYAFYRPKLIYFKNSTIPPPPPRLYEPLRLARCHPNWIAGCCLASGKLSVYTGEKRAKPKMSRLGLHRGLALMDRSISLSLFFVGLQPRNELPWRKRGRNIYASRSFNKRGNTRVNLLADFGRFYWKFHGRI